MTWEEIKELDQEPLITFGSHGYDHVSFGHITAAVKEKNSGNPKKTWSTSLGKNGIFRLPVWATGAPRKTRCGLLKEKRVQGSLYYKLVPQ